MTRRFDRYWPVIDLLLRATCLGVPTTPPPKHRHQTNVNQIISFIAWYLRRVPNYKSIAPHRLAIRWPLSSGEDWLTARLGYRDTLMEPIGLQTNALTFSHLKGFLLNVTGLEEHPHYKEGQTPWISLRMGRARWLSDKVNWLTVQVVSE